VRLAVSTEILLEYEEIIASRIGLERITNALHTLLLLPNVELITPFYRWKLIDADPDDDKFIDCFIASGAERLVSHDRHFDVVKNLIFPHVEICRIEELLILLEEQE
jgi:predicted nucleic acid-binding protein